MAEKLNVYIWDMDETLILLKSLLNGTYAEPFEGLKNVKNGIEIGKAWEDHILQLSDDHFFYEQVEDCNQPYLDVISQYDDGRDLSDYDFNHDGFGPPVDDANKRKFAYRFRVVAHKYRKNQMKSECPDFIENANDKGLHCLLDEKMFKSWENLYNLTDSYTDQWHSAARTCLEQCANGVKELPSCSNSTDSVDGRSHGPRHVNVLVTSGSLIPSLVKCLLFRLDNVFTCENVYSSWEVGKFQCFSWIKERFNGPNVQFCVIGDGWEECQAAEAMRWPLVKIDPQLNSSFHRFPGLTVADLGHYISVIYGDSDSAIDL